MVAHNKELALYDLATQELKSRIELEYQSGVLVTDSGTDTIASVSGAYYTSENDNGWVRGATELIYIDPERQMYKKACIQGADRNGGISLSGGEIANGIAGKIEYDHIRSFEELKEKAESMYNQ